jgi:hypothetical protein
MAHKQQSNKATYEQITNIKSYKSKKSVFKN